MAKFGIRKPRINRRIKARTIGSAKRTFKKRINPTYGKKGIGWVKNPKQSTYSKIYNKTTIGITTQKNNSSKNTKTYLNNTSAYNNSTTVSSMFGVGCIVIVLYPLSIFFPWLLLIAISLHIILYTIKRSERNSIQKEYEEQLITEQKEKHAREKDLAKKQLLFYENKLYSLLKKMQKTNNIETFFYLYEKHFNYFKLYQKRRKKYDNIYSSVNTFEIISEHTDQKRMIELKNFIKRYKTISLKKASTLKTGKEQKKSYQRSLNDLYEYNQHFDESIKIYLNKR